MMPPYRLDAPHGRVRVPTDAESACEAYERSMEKLNLGVVAVYSEILKVDFFCNVPPNDNLLLRYAYSHKSLKRALNACSYADICLKNR